MSAGVVCDVGLHVAACLNVFGCSVDGVRVNDDVTRMAAHDRTVAVVARYHRLLRMRRPMPGWWLRGSYRHVRSVQW